MYSWHATPNPPGHSPPSHSAPSVSSSTAAYQVPQLRWPASMMSRSQQQQQQQHQHPQSTATGNSIPTISPNLRMAQNSNHQPVSVVVEPRAQAQAPAPAAPGSIDEDGSEESDHSDGGMGTGRDAVVLDAPGESDYAVSSGTGRRIAAAGGGGGGAGGLAITATTDEDRDGDHAMDNINISGGDTRKHGKRLTTAEEVSLFDICNRHAGEFGQRSSLCKWWINVTAEFTRDQGHPYSWHSVRRKVEMVTKQRMKFLEEQREKGTTGRSSGSSSEDLSNPRWRAVVDAWIPTWQRWEDAEAKRIEKRDSRKTRKRKSRPWEYSWDHAVESGSDGWRVASSPVVDTTTSYHHSVTTSPVVPSVVTAAPVSTHNPVPVRLPPGFDSMFPSPNPDPNPNPDVNPNPNLSPQTTPQTQRTTTYSSYQPIPPPASSTPTTTATTTTTILPPTTTTASTSASPETNLMTALLETLGKLNKHLDAANPDPRSSPIISTLVSTAPGQHPSPSNTTQHSSADGNTGDNAALAASLAMLKEELRREMHQELRREIERDRASLEERLDSVQRTQDMILEMLRQEPA